MPKIVDLVYKPKQVKTLTILIAGCLLLLAAQTSEARGVYRFGKQESIYKIHETAIRDSDGKPLDLAYKISTYYFLAGVSVHDDGYVLQSRDDRTSYYSLPPEKIARYQGDGLLPNPLPKYSISFLDYLAGYSFWIIGGFGLLLGVLSKIRQMQDKQISSTNVPAPPSDPLPPGDPVAPPPAPISSEPSSFRKFLFWSGFWGCAGALAGTAAERLWLLTGYAAVLAIVEFSLMWWGPWRRWAIVIRIIIQFLLWDIFLVALFHHRS